MTVGRAHHGDLNALIAQSSDTSRPFSFDRASAFELEAELAKEINRRFEVIDDDPYVVHPSERHVSNLQSHYFGIRRCTCTQVSTTIVSELCHIPPSTRVNRITYGDVSTQIVVAEVVDRKVCFGVRQHARQESISKRAPSIKAAVLEPAIRRRGRRPPSEPPSAARRSRWFTGSGPSSGEQMLAAPSFAGMFGLEKNRCPFRGAQRGTFGGDPNRF